MMIAIYSRGVNEEQVNVLKSLDFVDYKGVSPFFINEHMFVSRNRNNVRKAFNELKDNLYCSGAILTKEDVDKILSYGIDSFTDIVNENCKRKFNSLVCIEEPKFLTIALAKKLIGKSINWQAVKSEDNGEYYTGTAKILEVKDDVHNPLNVKVIEGDNLQYAFPEGYKLVPSERGYEFRKASGDERTLTYSDELREVVVLNIF